MFMPTAKLDDWELVWAGQRVQVIKRVGERGVLEFGTEVVSARDGTLAAVLGASPGASTAVSIMLELAPRYLNARIGPESVRSRLRQLVPTIGRSMAADAALTQEMRAWTDKMLKLG